MGGLVFACLINSNIIYTFVVMLRVFQDKDNHFGFGGRVPEWTYRIPWPIQCLLIFPFAQLTPAGSYILATFIIPDNINERIDRYFPENRERGLPEPANGVLGEEHKAVEKEAATMGRLQAALERQQYTHGMLICEAVIESIPQSIIQLLAITFLGSPSTLQVASMTLSLLSVVSKGYFVSVSCDMRVFVLKFLLIAHDVFSLFYVASTVISREGSHDVELFAGSGFFVSYLAYIWFLKVLVVAAFILIAAATRGILLLIDRPDFTGQRPFVCLLAVVGWLLLFVPLVLAEEAIKLSWIMVLWSRHEPDDEKLANDAVLYSFMCGTTRKGGPKAEATGGQDEGRNLPRHVAKQRVPAEWKLRLAHLHTTAYKHLLRFRHLYHSDPNAPSEYVFGIPKSKLFNHTARLQMHLEGSLLPYLQSVHTPELQGHWSIVSAFDYMCVAHDKDLQPDPVQCADYSSVSGKDPLARFDPLWEPESYTRDELFDLPQNREVVNRLRNYERELEALVDSGAITIGEQQARLRHKIVDEVYHSGRLARLHQKHFHLLHPYYTTMDSLPQSFARDAVFYCGAALEGVSVAFSLVFPFVSYGAYFSTQNLLQHVCFGLLAASLLFALPLLPAGFRYIRWLTHRGAVDGFIHGSNGPSWEWIYPHRDETRDYLITSYHHPTAEQLLRSTVDPCLIPPDVSGLVGEFLPGDGGLEMTHLTLEECEKYGGGA